MSSNQNNIQNYEDEVDLKELILAIWKRKIMIISFTVIFALLAGIYSVFFISPVYNTKLNIIISMPEVYNTRYGEYKLPLKTNEQYMNLFTSNDVLVRTMKDLNLTDKTNVDRLRSQISIYNPSKDAQTSTTFEITVSANTPSTSLELAQKLYDNYIDFLDITIKEQVVNYFHNKFVVDQLSLENDLTQEQENLKANEALITQIKMELGTSSSNVEILKELGVDSNYAVPINTINPNYIKLQTDIIENKQKISEFENTINRDKKYIEELQRQKEAIEKFYEAAKVEHISIDLISIVESNVYMPSLPVAPSSKASPRNVLNVVIGTTLGGMLGVMTALFQWYWKKES